MKYVIQLLTVCAILVFIMPCVAEESLYSITDIHNELNNKAQFSLFDSSSPVYVPPVETMPVLTVKVFEMSDADINRIGVVLEDSARGFQFFRTMPLDEFQNKYHLTQQYSFWYQEMYENIWSNNCGLILHDKYAVGQDKPLSFAARKLNELMSHVSNNSATGFLMTEASILSDYRMINRGEYGGSYKCEELTGVGGYQINGVQTINDIPILGSIGKAYEQSFRDDPYRILDMSSFYSFEYRNVEYATLLCNMFWTPKEEIYPDIPLCSLSKVIDTLNSLYNEERINDVYNLMLGYVIYLDTSTDNPGSYEFIAIPTWVAEVSLGSAKRLIEKPDEYNNYTEKNYDMNARKIMINAQTGSLYDWNNNTKDSYKAPSLLSW